MKFLVSTLALALVQGPSTVDKFKNDWRQKAIEKIESHLIDHPECSLRDTPKAISRMCFSTALKLPKHIRMVVFPDEKAEYQMVFVNGDLYWNEEDAIADLIHEATHLTRQDGKWLCGADRPRGAVKINKVPVCRLFGESQYDSEGITDAIRRHLGL